MIWTTGFENFPPGSSTGSTFSKAVNDIKVETRARHELQHIFDEGDNPVCYHIAGECTVCGLLDGTPSTLLTIGGLQYSRDDGALYKDNGAVMVAVAANSHAGLTDRDVAADHPQYVTSNAEDTIDALTMAAGKKVTGLSVVPGEYADGYVMPYGLHIGVADTGGAKHDDDVLSIAWPTGLLIGKDKLNFVESTIVDMYFDDNQVVELAFPVRCVFPYPDMTLVTPHVGAGGNRKYYFYPAIIATGSEFPDDYIARVRIKAIGPVAHERLVLKTKALQ